MDQISINLPNGSSNIHKLDQAKYVSYFGSDVPLYNIPDSELETSSGTFILPLTEFKFDANVIGFEFYALNPGTVTLYVNRKIILKTNIIFLIF